LSRSSSRGSSSPAADGFGEQEGEKIKLTGASGFGKEDGGEENRKRNYYLRLVGCQPTN
jgi:hypothetical protein